mmetsp:Transcript_11274/g.36011  ORF Transcript_11274/g.36011 Transcript_11274/m.36011 type:complete len:393 (+) Transcript_11274:918-2096(+)
MLCTTTVGGMRPARRKARWRATISPSVQPSSKERVLEAKSDTKRASWPGGSEDGADRPVLKPPSVSTQITSGGCTPSARHVLSTLVNMAPTLVVRPHSRADTWRSCACRPAPSSGGMRVISARAPKPMMVPRQNPLSAPRKSYTMRAMWSIFMAWMQAVPRPSGVGARRPWQRRCQTRAAWEMSSRNASRSESGRRCDWHGMLASAMASRSADWRGDALSTTLPMLPEWSTLTTKEAARMRMAICEMCAMPALRTSGSGSPASYSGRIFSTSDSAPVDAATWSSSSADTFCPACILASSAAVAAEERAASSCTRAAMARDASVSNRSPPSCSFFLAYARGSFLSAARWRCRAPAHSAVSLRASVAMAARDSCSFSSRSSVGYLAEYSLRIMR